MGLFDALNIGMRGLNASQVSIDVSGQNISNANTQGYSRKRVEQQADTVTDDIYGQKGLGVEVTDITRVRNSFLDRQTWEQLGDKGMATELGTAYTRLEDILQEPSGNGLAEQMNKFWASWQDLANNPSDISTREAVKASANVLLDTFHSVYKQIDDYGQSMNNPLADDAKTVNDITSKIYQLNEQIAGSEANGSEKANDTRDQRDQEVRKLSELVDVQTVEDAHGRLTVTSGGNLLVGPSGAMQIGTYGVDQTLPDGTTSTDLKLKFLDSGRPFEPRSGSLKGIMDARSLVLTGYKAQLNDMAASLVKQVNDVHASNYTLNQATGVLFFDPTKTSAAGISLSDAVAADSSNIAAAAGGKITDVAGFQPAGGIPAAGTPVMDLTNINPSYQNLVQGSVKLSLASGAVLEEGAGKDYVVDYEKGTITFLNYAKYNAADPVNVQFSYNTTGYSGDGNGAGAGNLAKIRFAKSMSPDKSGAPTQSIGDFYSAVIGKMGIEKNQNSAQLTTKTFMISQMDTEQATVSGVSLDEEMTNMIKFENSYKASAKYIQTISQMLDVLMTIQ